MQLKIWTEESKKELNDDQLFLKLIYNEDVSEDITLVACDKNGKTIDGGNILTFSASWEVIFISCGVNKKIPLKTDIFDRATVYTYEELMELESTRRQHFAYADMRKMLLEKITNQEKAEVSTH